MNVNEQVIDELTKQNIELRNNEQRLRSMLWRSHGCPSEALYGDDGELQCHNIIKHGPFGIDFKRESLNLIEWRLSNDEYKRIIPMPLK